MKNIISICDFIWYKKFLVISSVYVNESIIFFILDDK